MIPLPILQKPNLKEKIDIFHLLKAEAIAK